MLQSTFDIVRAGLKSDPTISPTDRSSLLVLLRNGTGPTKPTDVVRIIRRREAAQRLSCSLRTIDKLAATGVLRKRKLPGRVRASGFLESDLVALLVG